MTMTVPGTGCPRGMRVARASRAPACRAEGPCWAKYGPQERWVLTSGTCAATLHSKDLTKRPRTVRWRLVWAAWEGSASSPGSFHGLSTGEAPCEDEEDMGVQPPAESSSSPQKLEEAGRTLARSLQREPALPTPRVGPHEPDFGLWLPEQGESLLLEARGVWSSAPASAGRLPQEPAGGGPVAGLLVPAAHALNRSAWHPAAQP